jgi:dTDP-4-amino-4,6-dideoxygalactose transaminase
VYSNWGPLSAELEERVAELLGAPRGGVISSASGTLALIGAILAAAGEADRERPLALVPDLTWIATAAAVERCGYRPYLVDVDPETWMADPARLAEHPVLDGVGLVVPVAPFGRPVPQAGWESFRERTGIPVVIDGAASFEMVAEAPEALLGGVPVAISFHATKGFSAGEGGCVACADLDLATAAKRALNYGIHMTREARSASINGKMSEYHAAVGLAELDGWPRKRDALARVGSAYRESMASAGLAERLVAYPEIGLSYVLLRCLDASETDRVRGALWDAGIDSRLWYEHGARGHPFYAEAEHEPLDVAEALAGCLLGLPLAPDLPDADIARVVEVIEAETRRR